MKKNFIKATLAVAAISVVCTGAVKTYQSYLNSDKIETENMLLEENVLSYSDAGWIGKACKWVAGVCIDILGKIVGEDEPEPTHYTRSYRSCHLGRDKNGYVIAGNQEFCIEQKGKGANDCTAGWVGPCM